MTGPIERRQQGERRHVDEQVEQHLLARGVRAEAEEQRPGERDGDERVGDARQRRRHGEAVERRRPHHPRRYPSPHRVDQGRHDPMLPHPRAARRRRRRRRRRHRRGPSTGSTGSAPPSWNVASGVGLDRASSRVDVGAAAAGATVRSRRRPPSTTRHGAGSTHAVDEERVERVRRPRRRRSAGRSVLARGSRARRAWTRSRASHVPTKRTRSAAVGSAGSGSPGRSTRAVPSSARNRRSSTAAERRGLDVADGRPRPRGDLLRRGRSEARQVAPHEVVEGFVLAERRAPDRSTSRRRRSGRPAGVPTCPTAAPARGRRTARRRPPGPGRRRPPAPVATARRPRASASRTRSAAASISGALAVRRARRSHAPPPSAAHRPAQRPVVRRRQTRWMVARSSVPWTTRRAWRSSVRPVPVEVGETGPAPDVHRRRVLGLQAADGVQHGRQGIVRPLGQALPGDDGSAQVDGRELAVGVASGVGRHVGNVAARRISGPPSRSCPAIDTGRADPGSRLDRSRHADVP